MVVDTGSAVISQRPISDLAVAAVRRYCERRIRLELRDKMRLDVEVRGKAITIFECRPPWRDDIGPEWTKAKMAQFRFDPETGEWTVFWAGRNGRWLEYPDARPSPNIGDLLQALEDDVSGAFYG